ncbi:relaxase/mobilization nuclease domain-containing protein, partial [Massilia sp. DJPM01]|uniref:relaxase/mobilization nuclease domain-containing protein n=1 Tax=Massilia sp. DJPM01 TaxID=3024404 RepID=UPI00259D7FE4
MIAKAVKGKGFRGALEYDLTKEQGRVIDKNMAGEKPRELAAEFGEIRKLRPNLGKAVLHVSLSAAPGEILTDDQWREIGKRYMAGMGLENNQFVMTRHVDTEHEHIHILANRIRFDGSVTSDSHDYKRQEVIMRELEKDYGLQRVPSSIEAERKAPTKGEIEQHLRTGEPSTRQQLQQFCDAAARGCRSFTEYQERLEAVGVELVPVAQLEGAKLSGLSYRLDGMTMKGSDLGKGYSP